MTARIRHTLLVMLLVSPHASAYVLERTDETNETIHWDRTCLTWWMEASGCPDITPSETLETLRSSFATWDAIDEMYVDFEEGGATCADTVGLDAIGPLNVAMWRSGLAGWPYTERVVGLTTLTFDRQTGEIVDADVEFNAEDYRFSTDETENTYDLQQAVTHEIGHVLGLGHSSVPESVMYATAGPGAVDKRVLSQDDLEGIMTSHGWDAAPPVEPCGTEPPLGSLQTPYCPPPPASLDGGCAASSARGPSTIVLLLLLCAGLWRLMVRRRRASAWVLALLLSVGTWSVATPAWAQACNPYIAGNGEPIYWPINRVDLSIDRAHPSHVTAETMLDSVHSGLKAWSELPCVEMTVGFRDDGDGFSACPGEGVNDDLHCIYWALPDDPWPYGSVLIAVTLVHHNPQTAEIVDTDMAINGTGTFTWSSPPVCDPDTSDHDLLATLTHEFGHFFGLDHSSYVQSTMEAGTGPGDCAKRTLHEIDRECLCDTLTEVPSPVDPPPDPDPIEADTTDSSQDTTNGSRVPADATATDVGSSPPTSNSGGCSGSPSSTPLFALAVSLWSLWYRARRRRDRAPRAARAR